MEKIRSELVRIAHNFPQSRGKIIPILRMGKKWETLPSGWTEKSVHKFWNSLTGNGKHKVTSCIEKMNGKIDDPGAFCASLADKVMGSGWRKGDE